MITEHKFEKLIWWDRPGYAELYVYEGAKEHTFRVNKFSRQEKDGKIIYKLADDNLIILDKDHEQNWQPRLG